MNVLNQLSPEKSSSSYPQSKQNFTDNSTRLNSAVGLGSSFKKILDASISPFSHGMKEMSTALFSSFDKKGQIDESLRSANSSRDRSLYVDDDFDRLEKAKIDEVVKDKDRAGNDEGIDNLKSHDREQALAMDKSSKLREEAENNEKHHRQLSKLLHSVENAIEVLQKLKNNGNAREKTDSQDLLKKLLNLRLQLKELRLASKFGVAQTGGERQPTDVATRLQLQINKSINGLKDSILQGNTQLFPSSAEKIFAEFLENASVLQKKIRVLANAKQNSSLNSTTNGKVFLPGVEVSTKTLSTVDEKAAVNPRNLLAKDVASPLSPTQSPNHIFSLAEQGSAVVQGKLQLKAAQHQVRVTGSFIGKNFLKSSEGAAVKMASLPQFGDGLSGNLAMGKQSSTTSFDSTFSQFGFASSRVVGAKTDIGRSTGVLVENASNLFYGRAMKKSNTADAKLSGLSGSRIGAMLAGKNAANAPVGGETVATGPVVRAEEIIAKITGQVKMAYAGGRETINVRLQPAHLGDVNLWIKKQNGKISLRFSVDSEEVKTIIEEGIASIAKGLSGANIEMDSFTVEVKPRFEKTQAAVGTTQQRKPANDGDKVIDSKQVNGLERDDSSSELDELVGLEKASFNANKTATNDVGIENEASNLEGASLDGKQLEKEKPSRLSTDARFVAHSTHIKFAGALELNKFFA